MEFELSLAILEISAVAFLTSAITSIVGAGGGTALLLVMVLILPASAVVPVHGCIQLVSNSTRVILFRHHMKWPVILRFVVAMPLGVFVGLQLYDYLDATGLQLVIACGVLISLAIRPSQRQSQSGLPLGLYYPLGFVIGIGNILVGVLSPLLGAILRFESLQKEQMVATLGFFGFAGNIMKVAGFAFIGFYFWPYVPLIICASLAAIFGSIVGKKLLAGLSNQGFAIAFQIMLICLAGKIIWDVI